MTHLTAPLMSCVVAGLISTGANAQPYQIDWYTIDGGGGLLEGASYSLRGTVGQSDASGPLIGSTYTLTGGFWPGIDAAATKCTPADIAEPFGLLDLADITAFVSGFQSLDPIADFVPPFGTFDLADISAFVTAFLAGCP